MDAIGAYFRWKPYITMKKIISFFMALAFLLGIQSCTRQEVSTDVEMEILKILHESGHKDLMAYTLEDIQRIREAGPQPIFAQKDISDSVANFVCIRVDNQFYAPTSTVLINVVAVYGAPLPNNYSPYDTDNDDDVDASDLLNFIAGYGVTADGVDFTCWSEVQYFNEGQTMMSYDCGAEFSIGWLRRTPPDEPGYEPTGPDAETYDVNSFDFEAAGPVTISYTYVQ